MTPTRIPRSSRLRTARRGYRLVLPGGTPIAGDDPLLESYGARVVGIGARVDLDVLQEEAFDVGRSLRLELAPRPGERNRVRVLDAGGIRLMGNVPRQHAAGVAAALDHQLELICVCISEQRRLDTGERVGVRVLIAPTAFCAVQLPEEAPPAIERLDSRPRLVLVAGSDGTLRWWDPSARRAPLAVEDLPVTADLAAELRRLQNDWERFLVESEGESEIFVHWDREELEDRARALWRRTRDELASRYVVGWKPSGADRAVYADPPRPSADDDIPF